MSRNGSTRRFWSGTTVLSLLSILLVFLVVPVVFAGPGIKVALPSGQTVSGSPGGTALAPKGFSSGGGTILSSGGGGDPVDKMVGPITRINQPFYEGDCSTPAGCTQNNPSIAKSGNVLVTGYMSTWGLHQGTPTHVGLFSYSTDGGVTWNDGQLLLPQANPDQILGPPAITTDGNGNFWYAAEYQTITGECAIAVGQSQHPWWSPGTLYFDPPTLITSSLLDKMKNPRIAVDRRNGNLYVVYTLIQGGCGTMFEPGDPGVTSEIAIQEYDTATTLWSPVTIASLPQVGPALVDGPDVAVDANTSTFPFILPGVIYVAWEEFDPGSGFPVAPTHTISGATLTTGLGFFGPSYTIGPVNTVVPPPGYSGMLVYDPNCTTPPCSWVPGLRSFPSIATHPQKTGEAYVVWNSALEDVVFDESFESTFPPGSWSVTDISGSAVNWDRNDNLGVTNQTGGTGYSAAVASAGAVAIDTAFDSPAIPLPSPPDPATRVTLTFRSYFFVSGGAPTGTVSVSDDGGMTWIPLINLVATAGPGLLYADLSPWAGQTVMLRWEYVDGGPAAGNFWQIDDIKVSVADAIDSEVLFAKTTDQGINWFTPTRVNDNPVGDLTAQFMPAIATRTDDGLIKVVFYDQRNGSQDGTTDVYVAESRDSGLTFEPNVRVTATSMAWLPGGAFVPSDSGALPNYGIRIGATMDADHLYMAWSGPPAEGYEGPDIFTAYAQNIARISTGDLDFGNVCPGETKSLDFEIFNTGTADLVITDIIFTSGAQFALASTTPAFPITISPDSHVTFTIVMTLGPTDTTATDTIEISHNDPNATSPLILPVFANVQTPRWTVSTTAIDFGGVGWDNSTNPYGATRTMPIVVTNTSVCPVSIDSLTFASGTEFSSPTPIPFILTAGSNARIDVVFDPTSAGPKTDTVTINVTSPPADPASIDIDLSGFGLDPTVALELPGFGGVPVDDEANPGNFAADRALKIHNTGTANLQITNITSGDPQFTIVNPPTYPVNLGPNDFFNVTVRFNPSGAGNQSSTITVTADPGLTAQITATGVGLEPDIYLALPDFGTVPWDDEANAFYSVDRTLSIHNTGSANLIIQSVTASGDFSVVNGPADGTSVSPDATLPVTIRFNPSAVGPITGTVTVTYYTDYAVTTATETINATGIGLAPDVYLQVNDFGAVGVDDATSPVYVSDQDLIIHNTGSSNLIIKSVTGCGDFSVVNGPADGTVVSPDANLPVTIRFNPSTAGAQSCLLTVTYYTDYAGGGMGTTATATISASGIGLVPSLSLQLPGFGGVPADDVANPGNFAADRTLKIHNIGQANLQVTGITSSDAQFVISPETSLVFPINIAPNDVFNVTVRFNPTCGGNQSSTITVSTSPALTGNTVVATGVGLEPIIRLDLPSFGSVPSDDATNPGNNTRDSVLKIHNNGQAVLSVSGITFTGVMDADSWTIVSPVTFPLLIPPGSFQNVTIRFNPDDDQSGARTATINVANNTSANCVNPVNSPATVLATAYAYREDIKLELPSHGPVAWDDNANPGKNFVDKVLNICNVGVGNANLVVTGIATSGGNAGDFSILLNSGDLPLTIQGGECVPVGIRFNPSAAGQRTTNIVVTYDPDAQTTSITATGFGLDPAIYLQLADFGTVPWDDEANAFKYVDRILSIHNTGSANLILKSVAATGDYSVIGGPADGTSVSPDATFPVTIRFNPSTAGQISGTVTVTYYTDYTLGTTTTATIASTGIGLGIQPPYVEIPFFGGVPVDDATNPVYYKDNELQIHNYGDANLILKSVTATGDFSVIGGPIDGTKLSPNSTFPVTIRFNPSAGGLRQGTITVTYYTDYAGGGSGTTDTVTITAEGIGLVPNVYTVLSDFGAVPIEDAPINGYYFSYFVDRELKIQNTGDANVSITAITVTGANAADFTIVNPPTFPISIGPGKALGNITVRFNPTGSPTDGGNRTATINVHYNPGAQVYSIPATGVALSPVIDATGPINFGALPVVDGLGAECGPYEKEEVIYIFSKGQAILNVTSVTCVGTDCVDFTVLSPVTFPENVQPGQTITVRIRFNPSAAGTRSAIIRIASNAGTVDVPVSGIGLVGDPVLTPVPQLTFEPTVVGFEPQCYSDKVVTLYNRGPACIRIDSISIIEDTTGSYKIVEAPTTPFILGAGKGIPIKVEFNPTLVQRQITAKVEVISDEGEVTEKTVTTNLCGEGVNTGLRILVYDKYNNLLDGTNGFVNKVKIRSKGLKPKVNQRFLANELTLKEIDGCADGDDDIKFHLEYQLPPSYSQGGLINKSVFKVEIQYYTSTWARLQKNIVTVELPECGGFKIIKIQALK